MSEAQKRRLATRRKARELKRLTIWFDLHLAQILLSRATYTQPEELAQSAIKFMRSPKAIRKEHFMPGGKLRGYFLRNR